MADDEDQFHAQFQGWLAEVARHSARSEAIVEAAKLDNTLDRLLRSFFIADQAPADALLTGLGPLNGFSARIAVAYAVGLITREEHHALNLIRKIRNEFAHNPDASYDTPEIRARCFELHPPAELADAFPDLRRAYPEDTAKYRFVTMSAFLGLTLIYRTGTMARQPNPGDTKPQVLALIRANPWASGL